MMEQNPFPEKRKKREEGRQAPAPEPEPPGTKKSWWNRAPFRRQEKREKKGDEHLNPSRNQKEPGHHDGTEPPFQRKKQREEGRQAPEPEPEPGGTRTMMEQTPFPEKGKKREEGRQAPAPEPETRRARTS